MPDTPPDVRCPKCGRKQPAMGPDALYWCKACSMYHDADGDEGGDYSNNPTRRIEGTERRQQQRGRH